MAGGSQLVTKWQQERVQNDTLDCDTCHDLTVRAIPQNRDARKINNEGMRDEKVKAHPVAHARPQ